VIAEERTAIAGKINEIATLLITSTQKKDDARDQAQKALFDEQMSSLRDANNGTRAREAAVIDFVKTHIAPDAGPPRTASDCALDRFTMTKGRQRPRQDSPRR
jgi:hypothetical protein